MNTRRTIPFVLALTCAEALPAPPTPADPLDRLRGGYDLVATYRMGEQEFHEEGWLEIAPTLGGHWLEIRQQDRRRGAARSRWFLRRGADETYHLVQIDEHGDGALALEGHAEDGERLRFSGSEVFPWSPAPVAFDLTIDASDDSLTIAMTSRTDPDPFFRWEARRTEPTNTPSPSRPMQADDCATRFNDLFGRIFHRFHRVDSPRSSPPSPEMLSALHHLRDTGPITVTEACGHFHRSQSSVSELFNRLEARDLIVRYPDERDRRRTLVWLSDGGLTALADHATVLAADRLTTALATLTPDRRTQLIAILDELSTTPIEPREGDQR